LKALSVQFGDGEIAMKKALFAVLIAGALTPFEAVAQERAGDAALGAVSGAVVLGPVGAVAGAFIGYAAGPSISRSWGLRRSGSSSRSRRPARESYAEQQPAPTTVNLPQPARAAGKPPSKTVAPPVQGLE